MGKVRGVFILDNDDEYKKARKWGVEMNEQVIENLQQAIIYLQKKQSKYEAYKLALQDIVDNTTSSTAHTIAKKALEHG